MVIAIAIWLISGEFGGSAVVAQEGAVASADKEDAEIPLVRGVESMAEEKHTYLKVRAQTRANRVVEVRSEVQGRVEAIPGEKGTWVESGEVLCKIAVDTREADLSEARADLKSAQLEYAGLQDLKKRGLQSDINVAKAEAALERARARVKRAELALEKTRIVAPFDGVVDQQPVELGDYLSIGQTCVTLIEIDPLLVVGQVAEKNIGNIDLRDQVDIKLITGATMQGSVSFIGRAPESTTRTYPVEVTVPQPGANVRTGMSAEMQVPVGQELAHLISPASMVLNDKGVMGVRIVDDADTVRFKPIEVVSESPDGVWVSGLPERVRLITVGQEEVFDGQVVRVDLSPLTSVVSS